MKKFLKKLEIKFIIAIRLALLVTVLFGINSCNQFNNLDNQGQFDNIEIVIDKNKSLYNLHGFSPRIDFKISFKNNSTPIYSPKDFIWSYKKEAKYTFQLLFDSLNLEEKLFKNNPKTSSNYLIVNDINNNYYMKNNDSVFKLTLTLDTYVHGLTLEDTYKYYKEFFNSNFKIMYYDNKNPSHKFILKKSPSFSILFFFNGEEVKINDKKKMTKPIY